jgi:preprotein translocase subunit SecF
VESIRGFVFAMLIGIVVGTYSSYLLQLSISRYNFKREIKLIEKQHQES